MKVAVIGSGLSSLGAVLALVDLGIKPVIFDAGSLDDTAIPEKFNHLRNITPDKWSLEDKKNLSETLNAKISKIPSKFSFGDSGVYGNLSDIYRGEKIPPYSHFFGGFSHVWGGSALITPKEELLAWPITYEELLKYFEKAIKALPYAASSSDLDEHFGKPLQDNSLNLSIKDSAILNKLKSKLDGQAHVGQSRLLVYTNGENKCMYCGFCMTGCVYSSIFKSSFMIKNLIEAGKVEYKSSYILNQVTEDNGKIKLMFRRKTGENFSSEEFEKVYLATGAVETTRIVLNSIKSIETVELHGRGSYVTPLINLSKWPGEWPRVNTLPGIFVEFLEKKRMTWTHIQISNQNELVYKALGFFKDTKFVKIKKLMINRVSTLMINSSQEYGVTYRFKRLSNKPNQFEVIFSGKGSRINFLINTLKYILKISLAIKAVPIVFFTKINKNTYHIGGSFPMVNEINKENQADNLGRLAQFTNIHIVDSSIFPSIPSTTIGLLLVANAWRITEKSIT
jgi:hypothetical protein